jgi:isocitrate dehydrogenase
MKTQIQKPSTGELIHINSDSGIDIPNNPIIPYIEGDGIGVDITSPMKEVVDRAIQKAYGQSKKNLLDGNLRWRKSLTIVWK